MRGRTRFAFAHLRLRLRPATRTRIIIERTFWRKIKLGGLWGCANIADGPKDRRLLKEGHIYGDARFFFEYTRSVFKLSQNGSNQVTHYGYHLPTTLRCKILKGICNIYMLIYRAESKQILICSMLACVCINVFPARHTAKKRTRVHHEQMVDLTFGTAAYTLGAHLRTLCFMMLFMHIGFACLL